MDQFAASLSTFPSFIAYFAGGCVLITVFGLIYARITPHREIVLIRAGNRAAAISFVGGLLGFVIPLHLLPAAFDRAEIKGACVEKPIHGREGADIRILDATETNVKADGVVYQSLCPLPVFDGRHALLGSWVIGGKALGLGMREDDEPITRNTSQFVPHYFK